MQLGMSALGQKRTCARQCLLLNRKRTMALYNVANTLLHRALIVETVLIVFNDGGDRLEGIAVSLFYRFL